MIGISGTVVINGNRGRATLQCVQSIHRIDAQLGRYLDINSAWRDPVEQEKLYNAYRRDPKNNPIALAPENSVHCKGEAIDSDDGYNGNVVRVLNANGWHHTVYRIENGVRVLKEPWHFEYFPARDGFFGQTADSGATPFNPPEVKWKWRGHMEAVMSAPNGIVVHIFPGGRRNFSTVQEYNIARDQIQFFRERGASSIMALPELGDVPRVSWDTHNYLCDYIGAPQK